MADRRRAERPDSPDRRSFPRPPLWLNLLLLVLAVATFAYARHQRDEIQAKSAILFRSTSARPAELNAMRDELSRMDLTKAELAHELDGRMQYMQSLNSSEFYIAIDTAKQRLYFRLGNDVVREAPITVGPPKTITTPDGKRTWTFVPEKGAFTVVGKENGYSWTVPDWVYAMHNEAPPASPASVPNGLGNYVLLLPDDYVIQTPPPPESPLHGEPKPGSIMIQEADLAAIWPRITTQTRVYIF